MEPLTMCGTCCALCKAYTPNIARNDEGAALSAMWAKYYGLAYAPEALYCDGCRCTRPDARRVDPGCPVRACVLEKGLSHCGDCAAYPCETFTARTGLSRGAARQQLGPAFDGTEYDAFIAAYDNRTRLDAYVREKNRGAGKP